jgi:hypothetical protein
MAIFSPLPRQATNQTCGIHTLHVCHRPVHLSHVFTVFFPQCTCLPPPPAATPFFPVKIAVTSPSPRTPLTTAGTTPVERCTRVVCVGGGGYLKPNIVNRSTSVKMNTNGGEVKDVSDGEDPFSLTTGTAQMSLTPLDQSYSTRQFFRPTPGCFQSSKK